jgi:asparagine synthase (glutamine-hydrolysing)
MSMACGLEVRVPFCDHHLVEYVWNIPWEQKKYGEREKGLLRYCLQDLLPAQIVQRKKSPYPKTHNPKYLRAVQSQMRVMLDDPRAPVFQLLDHAKVREFIDKDLRAEHLPWFGQLMNTPALLAYWLQLNTWLRRYEVFWRID